MKDEKNKLDEIFANKEIKEALSRAIIGREYGLSSASVARLLILNKLVKFWQECADKEEIDLIMAVDISYLELAIQDHLYKECMEMGIILKLVILRL